MYIRDIVAGFIHLDKALELSGICLLFNRMEIIMREQIYIWILGVCGSTNNGSCDIIDVILAKWFNFRSGLCWGPCPPCRYKHENQLDRLYLYSIAAATYIVSMYNLFSPNVIVIVFPHNNDYRFANIVTTKME